MLSLPLREDFCELTKAPHQWCLPSTRHVLSLRTLFENGKKCALLWLWLTLLSLPTQEKDTFHKPF